MKNFFLALYAQILTVSDIKYVHKWNNQLRLILESGGAKSQMFPFPAVFIAFKYAPIEQLGEGRQLFYVDFELHILDWQLDTGDGNFEQNINIYDLKDKIFLAIQKFKDPDDSVGSCIRVGEEEDNDHNGIYHFIQRYKTTFVEQLAEEPVSGIDGPVPPLPLEIDQTTVGSADSTEPHVYNFTPL